MAFYKYKDVSLSLIYSSNDDKVHSNWISNYKINNTPLSFKVSNGSFSKQNSLAPLYNITQEFSAYFIEYKTPGTFILLQSSYSKCKALKVMLIGGGGSGGVGLGINHEYNGFGGGGGAMTDFIIENPNYTSIELTVGNGGASVSGGSLNFGWYGNSGNDGEMSFVEGVSGGITRVLLDKANGGKGGSGEINPNYNENGESSSDIVGGKSAYYNLTNYSYLPEISYKDYGKGGDGSPTRGDLSDVNGYKPNPDPSEAGKNGYIRVYFIY